MATIFKIRRDTASNWSSENPTLSAGEMGLDQTNNFIKMGDGSTAWNSLAQFTQNIENVEDLVGAMVTSNTETFISVSYDDSDGTLDFTVPVLDEDDLSSNSATDLATQQSIKAYVDAQVTASDLDFIADSGGALSIDLDSETLSILGGTGIDSVGSGNGVTMNIDSTVATLTGSQTLSAKTLTSPVINTGVSGSAILDSDTMSGASATTLASSESIKAYVDAQVDTADALSELADTTITSPADGSMLLYDTGNSVWIDNVMSGDATMADTGAVTLATVNSDVGSAGSTTAIPVVTVNAKGLVTAVTTASITTSLTVGADSGSNDAVALASDVLDFTGGTGIDTTVSDNDISIAIDSTVTTLTGSQALTNKTLTSPVLNTGVSGTAFLDEDDLTSNSATKLASQQSIKAYVDGQTTDETAEGSTNLYYTNARADARIAANLIDEDAMGTNSATRLPSQQSVKAYVDAQLTLEDLDVAGDTGTAAVDLDSQSLTIAGTANQITTVASGQTITVSLPDDVTIAGNLTVAGTQTTLSSTTIEVADPMLSLATNNGAADAVDIGVYGLYDTTGSQNLFGGIFRDASDSGKWKLFKDNQAEPTTTVNVSGTGYATGTLVADVEGDLTGSVTGAASLNLLKAGGAMTGAITTNSTFDGRNVSVDGTKLDTIETSATADQTDAEIRTAVEAATDSNVFTDNDHGKLNAIEDSATADQTAAQIKAAYEGEANAFTDAQFTKLANIETAATADQTSSDIRGLVAIDEDNMVSDSAVKLPTQQSVKAYVDGQTSDETAEGSTNLYYTNARADARIAANLIDEDNMASDSATRLPSQQSVKAYVDAEIAAVPVGDITSVVAGTGMTGGGTTGDVTVNVIGGTGITANADEITIDATVATLTGSQTLTNKTLGATAFTGAITTNSTFDTRDVATDGTKLDTIETSATADQTDAEIRTAVEAATDSNVFTDADHSKLDGIETAATADQTSADIRGLVAIDEDNMASDSAVKLPTQQSVKAYVDAQTTSETAEGSNLYFTNERVDDRVSALILGGTNMTATYDDTAGTLTLDAAAAGGYDLSGNDTDDVDEGTSNLYHTTARARAAISLTDAGGDGSAAYNSTTGVITYTGPNAAETQAHISVTDSGGDGSLAYSAGVITYTGPSATEVRAHLSAGTGITYSGGAISIGQAVATSSDVQFADLILSGDLTVNGTTTTVASTNTTHTDALIEYGNGTTGTPANDAGIVIERGDAANAFIGFDESADKFTVGTGTFTGASTGNLSITTGTMVANLEGATADLTGNITVGGTVDGRDVAADGTKLDGIESSATADQTGAQIKTAYEAETNAFTDAQFTKLANIETAADVTDATNVNAAGALMLSDTTTAGLGIVVDEDDMSSDLATKVPTQQSVKAYVDAQVTAQDLDVTTDSGTIAIDLDSETLSVVGTASEIETSATGNVITLGLPSNVHVTGNISLGGTIDSRDLQTDGSKLDAIEASADVTDAANVEAAGAVMESGANASARVPSGTTAQRDASPSAGYFRWNTTTGGAEIYDGTEWGLVGGGNTTEKALWEHANTVSEAYVMTAGNNAVTAGPITINSGASVTVQSGSTWAII